MQFEVQHDGFTSLAKERRVEEGGEGGVDGDGEAAQGEGEQVKADRGEGEEGVCVEAQPAE